MACLMKDVSHRGQTIEYIGKTLILQKEDIVCF